jgi:hypothetical protein
LLALESRALLVDTGDETLDEELAGFMSVIVSAQRTMMFPVKNAASEMQR